jgi:predicted  nucleic acid-binding Zn-ribbon protein
MSARIPPPPREIDLDSTDELPILRLPALAEEPLSATDDFARVVLPPAPAVSGFANRLRDLEIRLEQREERITQLEALVGDALNRELALRTELDTERYAALDHAKDSGQHLEDAERELATVRNEFDRREADLLAAQVEIDAQRRALANARMEVEQRVHTFRHQAVDLAELRSRSERLHEAVQTALGWRAADQQQISAIEGERDELLRQLEVLRAGTSSAPAPRVVPADDPIAQADAGLSMEVSTLRAGVDAARAAVAVYDEQQFQISQLQAEVARLQEQVALLQAQLAESQQRLAQRDDPLRHTQDVVVTQDIIVTAEAVHAATEESGTRPGLRALTLGQVEEGNARSGLQALVLNQGDVPVRVLLRNENGEDIRYPLGRRTTIGRTPDNDIQIDTTYISRHHAVVLSNAQDCVIEDLNSTNGVLVNGRRVGRQSLRDGDSLLIGNTTFTYQQFE